jgi:hypothetical protein
MMEGAFLNEPLEMEITWGVGGLDLQYKLEKGEGSRGVG